MPTASDLFPVEIAPADAMFAELPDLPRGTKLTVGGPNGPDEVMGYFAHWDSCIESAAHTDCFLAPRSPSNYQAFHQGYTVAASGAKIATGVIGSKGHAPPGSTVEEASAYYQYPEWSKMRVRVYENDIGPYVHGQLMPGVTYAEVEMIKASALSGHWQHRAAMPLVTGGHGAGIDCLGPTLVSRPGAPLDSIEEFALVASATAANGTIETFYSMPATVKASAPMTAPVSFDYDGLRYTRNDAGSYDFGPVPAPAAAAGSCSAGGCNGACKQLPDEATTAAADSLEAAAPQSEVDALTMRVDQLEAAFTRFEGDRMEADEMSMDEVA